MVASTRQMVERMRMLEWEITGVHPSDTDPDRVTRTNGPFCNDFPRSPGELSRAARRPGFPLKTCSHANLTASMF